MTGQEERGVIPRIGSAIAATAGLVEMGCAAPISTMEVNAVNPTQLSAFVSKEFSIYRQNPSLSELSRKITDQVKQIITYKRGGTTFTFFTPPGFQLSKNRIDSLWNYVATAYPGDNVVKFSPPKQAYFFLADFGGMTSYTFPRKVDEAFDVFVNLSQNKAGFDPLATEQCNTSFSSLDIFADRLQSDIFCNRLGIALHSIDSGQNYKEYQASALQKGERNGQQLALKLFDEKTYNQLQKIFSADIKKQQACLAESCWALSALNGKNVADFSDEDWKIIKKTSLYLKEIYSRFITGDREKANHYALLAIRDKSFISNIGSGVQPATTSPDYPAYILVKHPTSHKIVYGKPERNMGVAKARQYQINLAKHK